MERAIAWSVVALVHVVVAWVVTRPILIEASDAGPDLQVVFIEQPRPTLLLQRVKVRAVQSSNIPVAVPIQATPTKDGTPMPPRLMLVLADDQWDWGAPKSADGINFERNPLNRSNNPIPQPEAGRFRMRRQISPKDIVRGVSQVLGFWPPGYTDDPCAGLDKAVGMLMQPRNSREQEMLADAVRQREKYCN